jgi:hypothetical protein
MRRGLRDHRTTTDDDCRHFTGIACFVSRHRWRLGPPFALEKRNMTHHRISARIPGLALLILAASLVRAGEPTAAVPDCSLFFGGTGTRARNAEFDRITITINKTVSDAAIGRLIWLRYRIESHFSTASSLQESSAELYRVLQEKKCGQVIELSDEFSIAAATDALPHLKFTVLVFHLERTVDGRSLQVVSEYQRSYEFELTKQLMKELSLSGLGLTIAADIDAARVLTAREPPL